MTIQTKFDIGQTVWFIADNKVQSVTVNKIEIVVTTLQSSVQYWTSRCDRFYRDEELFPSKAALLESL